MSGGNEAGNGSGALLQHQGTRRWQRQRRERLLLPRNALDLVQVAAAPGGGAANPATMAEIRTLLQNAALQ